MPSQIELPRSLPSYFAHAEAERGRDCRRFCITLSYLDHGRLDKLQWWWRIGLKEESMLPDGGLEERRQRETARFHRHIERWLGNNGRRIYGDGPFPCLGTLEAADPSPAAMRLNPDHSNGDGPPGEAATG
jgi:hypothetical protein